MLVYGVLQKRIFFCPERRLHIFSVYSEVGSGRRPPKPVFQVYQHEIGPNRRGAHLRLQKLEVRCDDFLIQSAKTRQMYAIAPRSLPQKRKKRKKRPNQHRERM